MADTKISALPASTVPLAGTEVLPIVQSSTTKQVSVANLTAGRAISATELTLTTGNLIVASGKGVDFSATSGTGTSELLADYEEGTWTPVAASGVVTNSGVPAYSGRYTKVGRLVQFNMIQTAGNITVSIGAYFTGLPFEPGAVGQAAAVTNGNPNISGTALVYNASGAGTFYSGTAAVSETSFIVTGSYFST